MTPERYAEFERQTQGLLAQLPVDLRLILELRNGFKGRPYSYKHIANTLGVAPKAIQEAETHALRALSSDRSPQSIELGLTAIRRPIEPPVELADIISAVDKLTPELIHHLKFRRDDLTRIRWDVFEHLVGEFLAQQGFKDVRLVGRDPRTSADLYATWVLSQTGVTLRFFIEVKRWKHRVGITVINEVLGAMLTERERHGWHAGLIVAAGGFAEFEKYSRIELSLRGVDLKSKHDLLQWLDGYRPNKNGLWLPAPEMSLP